jgi:hypothetical protein
VRAAKFYRFFFEVDCGLKKFIEGPKHSLEHCSNNISTKNLLYLLPDSGSKKKLLSGVLYLFQFSKATLGLEIMPIPLAHKGKQDCDESDDCPLEVEALTWVQKEESDDESSFVVAVLVGSPVVCVFSSDYV